MRVAAAAGVPAPVVARSLGRSPDQVRTRRRQLVGRTRPPGRPYLPDEDEAIRGSVGWNGDLVALAHRLGRTPDALRLRARTLGVYDPPRRHRWTEWEDAHGRRWTPAEDELLRLHCALNPARLAQLLGRSDSAVCRRLRVLGLRAVAARSPHHPASSRNRAGGQTARLQTGLGGLNRRVLAAGPRGRPHAQV